VYWEQRQEPIGFPPVRNIFVVSVVRHRVLRIFPVGFVVVSLELFSRQTEQTVYRAD